MGTEDRIRIINHPISAIPQGGIICFIIGASFRGDDNMNKDIENMISKDTGVNIENIRKETWGVLEKTPHKIFEHSFRPEGMFIVGGNIYLAENREMGTWMLNVRSFCREVLYKGKCLRTNKKRV